MDNRINHSNVEELVEALIKNLFPNAENFDFQNQTDQDQLIQVIKILMDEIVSLSFNIGFSSLPEKEEITNHLDKIVLELTDVRCLLENSPAQLTNIKSLLQNVLSLGNNILNNNKNIYHSLWKQFNFYFEAKNKEKKILNLVGSIFSELDENALLWNAENIEIVNQKVLNLIISLRQFGFHHHINIAECCQKLVSLWFLLKTSNDLPIFTEFKKQVEEAIIKDKKILHLADDLFESFKDTLFNVSKQNNKNPVSRWIETLFVELDQVSFHHTRGCMMAMNMALDNMLESNEDVLKNKNNDIKTQISLIKKQLYSSYYNACRQREKQLKWRDSSENAKKIFIDGLSGCNNFLNVNAAAFLELKQAFNQTMKNAGVDVLKTITGDLLDQIILKRDKNHLQFFNLYKTELNDLIDSLSLGAHQFGEYSFRKQTVQAIQEGLSVLKKCLSDSTYCPSYDDFLNDIQKAMLGGKDRPLSAEVYAFSELIIFIHEAVTGKLEKNKMHAVKSVSVNTPEGEAKKIFIPDLDWRINPADLDFSKIDPTKHFIKKGESQTQVFNRRTYELYGNPIGEGGFGRVYLAQDIETMQWIAIKIPKRFNSDDVQTEVRMAEKAKNGFIIFVDSATQAMGMQLLRGCELWRLNTVENTSLLNALRYAKKIMKNIRDLHCDKASVIDKTQDKKRIFHKDLKGGNILVDPATLESQIVDFGLAALVHSDKSAVEQKRDQKSGNPIVEQAKGHLDGTRLYWAPEIYELYKQGVKTDVFYSEQSEIYALGMTFAELFVMVKRNPLNRERFMMIPLEEVLERTDQYGHFDLDQKEKYKEILKEIYHLVCSMTRCIDDGSRRPDAVVCAKKFNDLYNEAAKIWQPHLCIISVDDFYQLKAGQRDAIFEKIHEKQFDAIVLQGAISTDYVAYYAVRHWIKKKNEAIAILPFMLSSENQKSVFYAAKNYYNGLLNTINTRVFTCKNHDLVEVQNFIVENVHPGMPPTTTSGMAPGVSTISSVKADHFSNSPVLQFLKNDDTAMFLGMLQIQQMLNHKMNIKPNPVIKKKLLDQVRKIQQEKLLSEEKSDASLELAEINEKIKAEDFKEKKYKIDADSFKKETKYFLMNLPLDPNLAAQLIHYCSLRLFADCKTLQEALPYQSGSDKQQRCALFQNALYEYVQITCQNKKENADYWLKILEKMVYYKDVLVMQGICSGIANHLPKNQTEVYHKLMHSQQAVLDGKCAAIESFNPVPPPISYYKIKHETMNEGVLDVTKMIYKAQRMTLTNYEKNIVTIDNILYLLKVLKHNPPCTGNWNLYVDQHCPDVFLDIMTRVPDQNIYIIIQNCLEALRNAGMEKIAVEEIPNSDEVIKRLDQSCRKKYKEIQKLTILEAQLEESFKVSHKESRVAAEDLFLNHSALRVLHQKCIDEVSDVHGQLTWGLSNILDTWFLSLENPDSAGFETANEFLNHVTKALNELLSENKNESEKKDGIESFILMVYGLKKRITDHFSFSDFKTSIYDIFLNQKNIINIDLNVFVQFLLHIQGKTFTFAQGELKSTSTQVGSISNYNVGTLFSCKHVSKTPQYLAEQVNCNSEFLTLFEKIVMSETWIGCVLETNQNIFSGISKWSLPEDIRLLRESLQKTKQMPEQERVDAINELIQKINHYVKNNYSSDPRHPRVIAFMNSVGANQQIKIKESIKRLEKFVCETQDKFLITECGLSSRLTSETVSHQIRQ